MDENNRYGFTYRSEVKIKFDGDYKAACRRSTTHYPGFTVGHQRQHHPRLTGSEPAGNVGAVRLQQSGAAVGHPLQPGVHQLESVQELKATGNNGQTLFKKHEGFKDAYRIALGTTYFYDDNWTFRAGIAFDDSPVPAQNRSISIPDQDRLWLSAGTSYAFNKDASVDVGVSYMHGQKVTIKEKESPYTFNSEGKAWLYGANFNYRF